MQRKKAKQINVKEKKKDIKKREEQIKTKEKCIVFTLKRSSGLEFTGPT